MPLHSAPDFNAEVSIT